MILPPSKIPQSRKDVEALNEPFKTIAKQLIADIVARDLPMVVYETLRSLTRQRGLQAKGVSKLAVGPHCYGFAIDIVLDPYDARWPRFGSRPFRAIDGGGAAWDTGYEANQRGAATLARQGVRDVCMSFGELVHKNGLEWGGDWPSTRYTNYPIGWDPFHCNLKDWKAVATKLGIEPHDIESPTA